MEQKGKPKTADPNENGNLVIMMVFQINEKKSEISKILFSNWLSF